MPDAYVTAKVAADMTGHSERTIRRWLASGRLSARKTARGDWQIAIADLPAPAHHAETVEDLRRTVEDLRRRVALLERQVNRPVAPVTRSQAADGFDVSAYVPTPARTPDRLLSASDGHSRRPVDENGFPTSRRGRAAWVEEHGGPKATYVRDWGDLMQWTGEADAVASVRRRNGWEDWTPQ